MALMAALPYLVKVLLGGKYSVGLSNVLKGLLLLSLVVDFFHFALQMNQSQAELPVLRADGRVGRGQCGPVLGEQRAVHVGYITP